MYTNPQLAPAPINIKRKKTKNILDYIHGMINLDLFYFNFIDTPQFQRLRDINQLPASQFVFPSAIHTRFEHSLGTYHISNKFINTLKQKQPELEINQALINTISLCGLCHNLGHSGFSYPFRSFWKDCWKIDFNHHEMGFKIFNNIIESHGIEPDSCDESGNFDMKICENILTKTTKCTQFYEQIVSNTKNGIDSDIFDYLKRDVYKFGFPQQGYDYQILLNNAYVLGNNICYRKQDAFSIYELFMTKFEMAQKFYIHRNSKAIELMVKDIFSAANGYYKYNELINDVEAFMPWTDTMLSEISRNDSSQWTKAREIMNRIYTRDWYTFAGEHDSSNWHSKYELFDEETLLKYTSESDAKIGRDDIRVLKLKLNIGINGEDPIKNVCFYDNDYNVIPVDREKISLLLPKRYEESIVRVYITSKDPQKISSAQNALLRYCKEHGTQANWYKSPNKASVQQSWKLPKSVILESSVNLFK